AWENAMAQETKATKQASAVRARRTAKGKGGSKLAAEKVAAKKPTAKKAASKRPAVKKPDGRKPSGGAR
ncbi:MAG: hypothetical protein ABL997_07015, partial [Planctomycetota bacterium]